MLGWALAITTAVALVGLLLRWAARPPDTAAVEHELGDALAWLASVANLVGVDLAKAVSRYAGDCPRCGATPCACPAG